MTGVGRRWLQPACGVEVRKGGGCDRRVTGGVCGGVPLALPVPVRAASTTAVAGLHRLWSFWVVAAWGDWSRGRAACECQL